MCEHLASQDLKRVILSIIEWWFGWTHRDDSLAYSFSDFVHSSMCSDNVRMVLSRSSATISSVKSGISLILYECIISRLGHSLIKELSLLWEIELGHPSSGRTPQGVLASNRLPERRLVRGHQWTEEQDRWGFGLEGDATGGQDISCWRSPFENYYRTWDWANEDDDKSNSGIPK